ncbi:DUF1801 domain-containing protein [Tenacibaculum sp. TC6]|uniref:DUF1801 domain-containing protein n=1 Tax=Tenacibaculum sp. TC6 TaxID=3423223 RepID=UPI003D36E7FB
MEKLQINSTPQVIAVFNNYPDSVKQKMINLRNLIIETANEIDEITELEETLKWGEPSYITKIGSTLRIDWKPKFPNQYAMYFQCNSRLIQTFKAIFNNSFTFEGKRAILFHLHEEVPVEKLKHCIKAALTYHTVKHLPNLNL